MGSIKSQAFILRLRPYGEGKSIIDFYSREEGRQAGVARGLDKPGSKLRSHLQPGNLVRLEFRESKGKGLPTVTSALAEDSFPSLRENSLLFFYSSYYLELIEAFTREGEGDESLFMLLYAAFKALPHLNPLLLSRWFEVQLMTHTGFGDFYLHGTGATPKEQTHLRFLAEADLKVLPRLKISDEDLKQLKKITLFSIQQVPERKIKSADFID